MPSRFIPQRITKSKKTRIPKLRDELIEAGVIVNSALSQGKEKELEISSNDWESASSSDEDSIDQSDIELEKILARRRQMESRGLISSRFEVESLISSSKKRDRLVLQERRRSNYLMAIIIALLLFCAFLLVEMRHSQYSTTSNTASQEKEAELTNFSADDLLLDNRKADYNNSVGIDGMANQQTEGKNNFSTSETNKSTNVIPTQKAEDKAYQQQPQQLYQKQQFYSPQQGPPKNPNTVATSLQNKNNGDDQIEVMLKNKLESIATWNVPFSTKHNTAFFWNVPLGGGNVMEEVATNCYGLVLANGIGRDRGHQNDSGLKVFTLDNGAKYVNVDTSTTEGLIQAKQMGLVTSKLADIIISPYIYETAEIFGGGVEKAKCFTLMREPRERAISLFHRKQKLAQERNHSNSAMIDMTIDEYAKGPFCEENWMTRVLTNERQKPLTMHHLQLAKEMLGRKCMIGLYEKMPDSIRRFKAYFGWEEEGKVQSNAFCTTIEDDENEDEKQISYAEKYKKLFTHKNGLDIALYEYAIELFQKQELYSNHKVPPG